ncbi:PREDICTED: ubiquitin carboxyl-terminal hydrolase 24-like [Acropora digitifera]|uniref:ubiquitin carboxyl-terminal hydrolase 24-like n=1 Tax=Acropora digitifera TaxID=70779 RepID=UPI00077A39C2|nr:PREDICTED: ubiquitin carboxyl-terminal hydrolase 24-like [Acropora digitifera]
MDEANEGFVNTLLNMGFVDDAQIRRVLSITKNDLNQAVALLTGEDTRTSFDFDDTEVKETETQHGSEDGGMDIPPLVDSRENDDGEFLTAPGDSPPSYDEAMNPKPISQNGDNLSTRDDPENMDIPLEFPTTNLCELEDQVFSHNWTIPIKRNESLGKCLLSAARFANEGLAEADENCKRFIDRALPECFKKLLTTQAVHGWKSEIHEGIYDMLQLLLKLIVARLKYQPVPFGLLEMLTQVFDPETEFHFKNRSKPWSMKYFEGVFGPEDCYAVSPLHKDPRGWLVNLINKASLIRIMPSIFQLANLLANRKLLWTSEVLIFSSPYRPRPSLDNLTIVDEIVACSPMARNIGVVFDNSLSMVSHMLAALLKPIGICASYLNAKVLSTVFSDVFEKTLQYIQELTNDDMKQKAVGDVFDLLTTLKLLCMRLWQNNVSGVDELRLDVALKMLKSPHFNAKMNSLKEVHKLIDDCEKNRNAKVKISQDVITEWLLQNRVLSIAFESMYLLKFAHCKVGKHPTEVDNIHNILSTAAVRFNSNQLEHLFVLIQQSWGAESDRMKEKLLVLIGRIGKEARVGKIPTKVLDLLWSLSHLPSLTTELVEQALRSHIEILSDSCAVKEQIKKNYAIKCVEDIKKGVLIVPAIRQLLKITRGMVRQQFNKNDKGNLQELNKSYDIIKMAVSSLVNCHQQAVSVVGVGALEEDTLVDGRYTHKEFVSVHLQFLAYVLEHGNFYLQWHRARDIWDCLVANPVACDFDREVRFDSWLFFLLFSAIAGFACFREFMNNVNLNEHRIKETGSSHTVNKNALTVEKMELVGLDYLWRVVLEVPSEEIAMLAVEKLMEFSYTCLSSKLKKDPVNIHKKFILECYKRLEDLHAGPRTLLPHGASFHGYPININVSSDLPRQELMLQCHSNESLKSLRHRIASRLNTTPEQIQLSTSEKLLLPSKDQKLLYQLGFEDDQMLFAKVSVSGVTTVPTKEEAESQEAMRIDEASASGSNRQTFALEQEKMMPGVIMATECKAFDKLYQLAELEEPSITVRVQRLLMLLPTDPDVQEGLESIGQQFSLSCSPGSMDDRMSSTVNLQDMFKCVTPGMSPFRILYNLEVLSSKLMPTLNRDGGANARMFKEHFLAAGGLSIVVNILQKDMFPQDVDTEIRRGCYAICLQLARFLLCGQSSENSFTAPPSPPHRERATIALSPVAMATGTMDVDVDSLNNSGVEAKRPRSSSMIDDVHPSVRVAIETMGRDDFAETIACFMRVAWAAAAGRINLAGGRQRLSSQSSDDEGSAFGGGGSDTESVKSFKSSVSNGNPSEVTNKDVVIVGEALQLLVLCLQLRTQLMGVFYYLPNVNDFIVEVLVGSLNSQVRSTALEQFLIFSQTPVGDPKLQTPNHFLLNVMLTAPLPLWTTAYVRGKNHRLQSQCSQFFDLLCRLLEFLTEVKPTHFYHFQLTGEKLTKDILNDFLFPASKLIFDTRSATSKEMVIDVQPRCVAKECQVAALELLVELAEDCSENLFFIVSQLISMHHIGDPATLKEWEFQPRVAPRAQCGFVGLKNAGATCYMNSVLQQLYMQPALREAILSFDDSHPDKESVFFQIQSVFGHLMDSKLQYFAPEQFWKCFKLWGQPVNVREQQDAFEFFSNLTDQLDEFLKNAGQEQVFKKTFCGMFADQKICKECNYRYEREEAFHSLQVTVKNHKLEDSLEQFVNGEILEGDNAYFCEKCNERRTTVKRMCIKTLPPVLVIQLKRFGYDWEAGRALKFDDHFEFPWVLNMEPYTTEGVARRESLNTTQQQIDMDTDNGIIADLDMAASNSSQQSDLPRRRASIAAPEIQYELVGVIVHSGQANAGHYYSFIKDRNVVNGCKTSCKWFKFNDIIVEEFDMNEVTLEAQCFGGTYKANVYDSGECITTSHITLGSCSPTGTCTVFFFQRLPSSKPRKYLSNDLPFCFSRSCPPSPSWSSISSNSGPPSPTRTDGLSQLTALLQKGERKGIFKDKMPATIQRVVHTENLQFMQNRDVYNEDYFRFILNLASCNTRITSSKKQSILSVSSLQLAVNFLFNTYFRTTKKLRSHTEEWCNCIETIVKHNCEACSWFIHFLVNERGKGYVRPFLLECPSQEVRFAFAKILCITIEACISHGLESRHLGMLIENLLHMCDRDVVDNHKSCSEYFWLMNRYATMNWKTCKHLITKEAFTKFLVFLVGPNADTGSNRRWSSIQAQEFTYLYSVLATLVCSCDVSTQLTVEPTSLRPVFLDKASDHPLIPMPPPMEDAIFGVNNDIFLREMSAAICDVMVTSQQITNMFVHCSWCNEHFSMKVLQHIKILLATVDMKNLVGALLVLLMVEDPLQLLRIKCIADEQGDGVLAVIKSSNSTDSRRAYQCIKFLVQLANKCPQAKDYLLQNSSRWQWAVQWLKRKMNEHYWAPHTSSSNEHSNSRTFQRTSSAADTLAEATALLTELEAKDGEVTTSDDVDDSESKFTGEDWDKEVMT